MRCLEPKMLLDQDCDRKANSTQPYGSKLNEVCSACGQPYAFQTHDRVPLSENMATKEENVTVAGRRIGVSNLDPGEGANVLTCARVALILRDMLKDLKLYSATKVSGSKGIQVYVPLNTSVSYDQTQAFAKAIAELLAAREPKLIVAEMAKV